MLITLSAFLGTLTGFNAINGFRREESICVTIYPDGGNNLSSGETTKTTIC